MSCHFTSLWLISFHFTSLWLISFHFKALQINVVHFVCHFISFRFMSLPVSLSICFTCLWLSFLFMSCHVMSCHVISFLSDLYTQYIISYQSFSIHIIAAVSDSFHFLFYCVISFHIIVTDHVISYLCVSSPSFHLSETELISNYCYTNFHVSPQSTRLCLCFWTLVFSQLHFFL